MNETLNSAEKGKPRFHRAWLVLIGCCFMQAGALGAILNSAGVFFSPISQDLGISITAISAYLSVYSWATCVGMFLVAQLFPKFDVRITMSICITCIIIALGLMSTYNEPWQWYISGGVFGLAGSFIFMIPAPVLLTNWFVKKRGFAIGLATSFSGIGAALLSPLFTSFIMQFGWRTTYLIVAGIVAVCVLPFTLFVFRFKPEEVGLKPYGWEEGMDDENKEDSDTSGVPLRKALPTLAFIMLLLFAGLTAMYAGFNNQLPTFALSIGNTAMFGATLVSAASIGNIVSKILMGFVSDFLGAKRAAIIQLGIVFIAMILFPLTRSEMVLYVCAFLFGFQNSLVAVSCPMLIREVFGNKSFTQLFAYARLGAGLVSGIGMSAVAMVYDAFGTYSPAFYGGAVVAALAIVTIFLAYQGKKKLTWEE